METVYIERREVEHLIAATFPEWNGQKVRVCAAEQVTVYGLNWSGGSRNQYRACTLNGEWTGGADAGNAAPPWANPVEGKTVAIPAGCCLIEHSIFCGKDTGLRIYIHPTDMPRYLPPTDSTLSAEEKVMLKVIRSYISSYRREEARRAGINAARYEQLVGTLQEKGLLTKQGGLTLAGKNAAGSL